MKHFIALIKKHSESKAGKKVKEEGDDIPMLIAKGPGLSETQTYTLSLYRKGMNIQDNAAQQGVSEVTVLKHYVAIIRAGQYLDVPNFIGKEFETVMNELTDADPYASLSEIKADLSVELNNEEFRLILAWREAIGVA